MCVFILGGERVRRWRLGVNKCSNIRYTLRHNKKTPKRKFDPLFHAGKSSAFVERAPVAPSVSTRKLIGLDDQIYIWL